jgi:ATP-dependent RNA helicase DDX19/DBP5
MMKDARPHFYFRALTVMFLILLVSRTGRFGRKGTAINLVSDQRSIQILAAIESHFATGGKEMIQNVAADAEALGDVIEI